jgi:NADH-quinone oxidoreductase subunit G
VTQYADGGDDEGKVVMACMTPVTDGMHIGLEESGAAGFRAGIIEALMTNHPHDCPVCEEGGECHLQDMTEMSGHTFRRYRGLKRTHRNQYLGPFINHEMNRCIACYRCVRFYRDYAGGEDLSAQAAHNHVYFGRERDGVLESPFSGNLVEICPTGVFTDRTYSRHYARKWDLQSAPSVCTHCAVGCNTTPAERYDRLVRITNRYNHALNGYFLCDRGRFGYDFNNAPQRIRHAYRPAGDGQEELDGRRVLADLLDRVRDPDRIVYALGSPRASVEDNFALKSLVGDAHFYAGVEPAEWACLQRHRALAASHPLATIREVEEADAALIIGEDLANTSPRVELALRQMVRNEGLEFAATQGVPAWQDAAARSLGQWYRSPVWQLVPARNRLSEISDSQCFVEPDAIAAVAAAVAHALDPQAPEPAALTGEQRQWAEQAAQMLRGARRPLLLGGSGLGRPDHLDALANIALALKRRGGAESVRPKLYLAAPEANSLGLSALAERSLGDLLDTVAGPAGEGGSATLVILENDLSRRLSPEQFERLRAGTDHWLVLDHLATATADRADAVLPVPSPFEKQGTLINASGHAQAFFAVRHSGHCQPLWRQLARGALDARDEVGSDAWAGLAAWQGPDQVRADLAVRDPAFAGIEETAPSPDYRQGGRKLLRQSHRYSGRTAMHAHEHVSETPPPRDPDSHYAFSMEGVWGDGAGRATAWAPGWNSEQALNKFQDEVGGDWRAPSPLVRLPFRGEPVDTYRRLVLPAGESETTGWRLIPRYGIFASEELSGYAQAIIERREPPRAWLDGESARHLSVSDWDSVEIHRGGASVTLYVAVDDSLPAWSVAVTPQHSSIWLPFFQAGARVDLKTAREPLPRPPQLIASDGGGRG